MSTYLEAYGPKARDVFALTKPRITVMTILVAFGGMLLAPTPLRVLEAACALLGIALLVSGSSAFNMYIERDFDGLMTRTKNRPLPAGRLSASAALKVGWVLSLLAIPALWLSSNVLTVALGIFSLSSYVLIYTPMKRTSCMALFVGAVPGAMPALLGYTAAANQVDRVAMVLFGVAFLWQIPHFIAISIFRESEYTAAGYPVVSAVFGARLSDVFIFFSSVLLVLNSILVWTFDIGHTLYLLGTLVLSGRFLWISAQGFYTADRVAWSKKLFYESLYFQSGLFLLLALDVTLYRLF